MRSQYYSRWYGRSENFDHCIPSDKSSHSFDFVESEVDIDQETFIKFENLVFFGRESSGWDDADATLIVSDVAGYNECYQICYIVNDNKCNVFRYTLLNYPYKYTCLFAIFFPQPF